MIENNVIVALGTDFNPNAYCMSMPYAMNLLCVNFKILPSEALVTATLNAAYSIKREKSHGSIEKGKSGDLVLIKADRWEHIIYQMGLSPIAHVIKSGKVVYSNKLFE